MKYPELLRITLLAAATLGLGGVLAQTTAPSQTTPAVNAPVVSDVAPPPAEDRSSTGALVMSPVRAQRDNPTATMGAGPAFQPLGRHADRRAARKKTAAELERARMEQALELRRRGAAGLIAN